jgi:myo-inositol 2-dehydrogenase / D-chiro-inositol 1-dehydrogenase
MSTQEPKNLSRREFITAGAAAATALSAFPFVRTGRAQGDKLRVGAIGVGGRGTGACANAIEAGQGSVDLVAMADVSSEVIEKSLNGLKTGSRELTGELQNNIKVDKDHMFTGDEAWKELLAVPDLDYVILTTPPGFRPLHFEAAIKRGLHVFAEKPVATDPVGCRKVRTAAEQAKAKGLSVVVGLQSRHDPGCQETIKRAQDGGIGEFKAGSIQRMGGFLWHRGSDPSWSEMEYQCRNWYYWAWLSGDQIVEMVVHQVDRMNWTLGAYPISAVANGGRQVRTDPKFGNIYDHMSVDFEYPNDVHVNCMLRQIANCENRNENRVVGTLGETDSHQTIRGANRFRYREKHNATVLEHAVLQDSIRNSKARNDMLDYAVDSTLSCIMGREAAYTGKLITMDEMLKSDLDLAPADYHFNATPPKRAVAMPGTPRPR